MFILPYVEPSEINYLKYIDTTCTKYFRKNDFVPCNNKKYIYLKTGQLKCIAQNFKGEERILYFVEKNNVLNILCNHINLSISIYFIATENSEVIYIPKQSLLHKLDDKDLDIHFTEICKKNNIVGESLMDLTFYPTKYRLYKFIYEATKTYGNQMEDGILISKKFKYADIANFIGCHRTNISKYINDLINAQIIDKDNGYFVIKDLHYFENYLNSI